jgi:hypothetical protein
MNSEFIKPAFPLVPGRTKLSPLDQVEGRVIVPPILVFQLGLDAQDSVIQDLRDGLAKTIEDMPFLAADIIPDDLKRGTVQMEIPEDAGVWFHVQYQLDVQYKELELRQFAPACFPIIPLIPEPREHDFTRSPVLTVQATFITGGLLLVKFCQHVDSLNANLAAGLQWPPFSHGW